MATDMIGDLLAASAGGDGSTFGSVIGVTMVAATAYAAGRLHQWYRHALERHDAWRAGYDQASHSLFRYAVHLASGRRVHAAAPAPVTVDANVVPLPTRTVPAERFERLERFEQTTRRVLPAARHASSDDEPTTVIRRQVS